MDLRKIIKPHFSRRVAKPEKKRNFNKTQVLRRGTFESLQTQNSRSSDGHDEHADEGRNHKHTNSGEAQVIPLQDLDEWALFILLEKAFGVNKFRIEQTYEAFKVWAPRSLGEDDIERCKF